MNNYENLINIMLEGRYRLTRIIGVGGMAVVYEADDLTMKRKVAVKMLKDEIKEDIREVKRFINESRAVAMLSHPNIVHIYDVSVRNSESHYIVMELIDGITLKDYIIKKGRLGWREAISYAEQILNALNHAHGKGIIHRDIKPQNIMLLRDGGLKITDFGIAKMRDSEPLTITDKAIGTAHYMSPEQANGESVTNVSDIYSTGVLLYEMATGNLPFEGDTAINVAMKQINEIPKNPRELAPEIPKGLSQIILKAMNKAPKDRYQSAGDMIKQLSIVSANPAVVFNNAVNTGNGQAGSNLPVVADAGGDPKKIMAAINNGGAGKRELVPVPGGGVQNKIEAIDKIDEDAMRRKGRTSKKGLRRRNSRSMLPIISGVTLAFLIVLGVSVFHLIFVFMDRGIWDIGGPQNETIAIPSFTGKLYNDDLVDEMAKDRLAPGNITYVTNDDVGAGRIISQSPEAGDERRFRSNTDTIAVNFVVSQGKDSYVVEDLAIKEYREVEMFLRSKRINVVKEEEPHDMVPIGYIIYTEPAQGILLNAGDTIYIYVSTGQEIRRVIMPDLRGESEANARRILEEAQIVIKRIDSEHSEVIPAGHIIDQDITPFRSVPAKSTRVTLRLSLGPRPTEPPPTEATTEAADADIGGEPPTEPSE